MIVFTFLGLLAFVSAAPQYMGLSPYTSDELTSLGSLERALDEEIFSLRKFWQDLARDMRRLELSILDTSLEFIPRERIEGNVYKIELGLAGYKESDISVQTGRGQIKIAAYKNTFGASNGLTYMKILPVNVGEGGYWSYSNDVLSIELPLKATSTSPDVETKKAEPEHSREEIEKDDTDDNMNADVGAETTVLPDIFNNEILTNEIPQSKVEATTYSENITDDIQFVPVRY